MTRITFHGFTITQTQVQTFEACYLNINRISFYEMANAGVQLYKKKVKSPLDHSPGTLKLSVEFWDTFFERRLKKKSPNRPQPRGFPRNRLPDGHPPLSCQSTVN